MIDTMNDRTYDVAAVRERFGVDPEKVPEIWTDGGYVG
jgi:DNA polymerase-1